MEPAEHEVTGEPSARGWPAGSSSAFTGTAVLVPVKAFADAKVRLAQALPAAERASLARWMGATVLAAAGRLPTAVACDDDEVARWAVAHGAMVIWTPGRGLNGAVQEGVLRLAGLGARRVVVAHADLPFASDLPAVAGDDGIVLVPDRHDDGTNVLAVPAHAPFRFSYGPGSFARHCAEAARLGYRPRVLRVAELGWDVDLPADLDALAVPD